MRARQFDRVGMYNLALCRLSKSSPPDHLGDAGEDVVAVRLAKGLLAQFAGGGVGEFGDEFDRVGLPPFGNVLAQVIANCGFVDVTARRTDDQQQRAFVPFGVGW